MYEKVTLLDLFLISEKALCDKTYNGLWFCKISTGLKSKSTIKYFLYEIHSCFSFFYFFFLIQLSVRLSTGRLASRLLSVRQATWTAISFCPTIVSYSSMQPTKITTNLVTMFNTWCWPWFCVTVASSRACAIGFILCLPYSSQVGWPFLNCFHYTLWTSKKQDN